MTARKSFASDNNAGVHPAVLAAIARANSGHEIAYGDDRYTRQALRDLRRHFGTDVEVFLVFNGTGANTLSLRAAARPYQAVICASGAHLAFDECGAPEAIAGCKLLPCTTDDGKLTVSDIASQLRGLGSEHHVQPRLVSITQSTELGTVYSKEEIRALADFAHARGLLLHMDGARLANAAAALSLSLRATTRDCGVDILSFGGTKNGALMAEAVIIFNHTLAKDFKYLRKQGMQLASKMRFLSAQFSALLKNNLWLKNARQANRMAALLGELAALVPGVKIVQPVQANAVFARLPAHAIAPLQKKYFFYVWDEKANEVRWVCSFDTSERDVREFVRALKACVS